MNDAAHSDFSIYGPIEVQPLSHIQRFAGATLARSWTTIPHVTHSDEADISALDALRRQLAADSGEKITPLAFMIKAATLALKQFPHFNASLCGDTLVYKKYFHIGFAVDTPRGLLVPVIRDVDRKTITEIAVELAQVSQKAREKKLTLEEMAGSVFSVTNLGGIGGTAFTPIINQPEVAILGLSRASTAPVWKGTAFVPREMLPLSLSYDHRVIDGADAARFLRFVAEALEQPLTMHL